MPRGVRNFLPLTQWPPEDRRLWEDVFRAGDPFEDEGAGAHLAAASRQSMEYAYGRFLQFIASHRPEMLARGARQRPKDDLISQYGATLAKTRIEGAIATELHLLRLALRYICPASDWPWLLILTKRFAAIANKNRRSRPVADIEHLYTLGLELMNDAAAALQAKGSVSKENAFAYRDGFIIAFLASFPLRRRTLAALDIDTQLVETGDQIFFDIPAANTKTKRPMEVPLAPEMIACLKLYLTEFRPHIPGADEHNGLFASNKGQPMDDGSIYDAVRRRTKAGLGVSINLHRFRSMAGRLWSIHAPASIRGVKDVLGHAGFSTTDQNYIPSQSRDAGRVLGAAMQNRLNGKKGKPGYES